MTEEQAIEEARSLYCDSDLEIDNHPRISEAREGYWVAAWVWVEGDDLSDEEEDSSNEHDSG